MARILIVDDDAAFREALLETVTSLGHDAEEVSRGAQALSLMKQDHFDAVLLDQRMPGVDGLGVLKALRDQGGAAPPIIMLTAYAGADNTIEAMRLGAFDHLAKPISRDAVQEVLTRALRSPQPSTQSAQHLPVSAGLAGFVGDSPAMREVHKRIGLAAASTMPVLVLGETGTGKEMVARALHRHSDRAAQPFIAVNCSAIPSELLESELFGHVRGAFTGATGDRPGCFRAADGGVLLLDEIGDMALETQAKMLRVLQEGEVTPVGATQPVRVDVRVVAATHKDLPAAVRAGQFREDLLWRLDVLSIHMPPLRERTADILPLARYFLERAAGSGQPKALSHEAEQALLAHRWPGNVRELRNGMERCQALSPHPVIAAEDLQLNRSGPGPETDTAGPLPPWLGGTLPEAVSRLERVMIQRALDEARGNRAEAARLLGIHRQLLYRKLAAYGME
ncbi:sigma-54-dependent transcriptional regulator [Roseateles depolymerans]|uniref:ATPase AAA n=1 Tax=Roseateles depolymerans TaxID=76731 RepID=A0A0U3LSK7_9BURK|nr:sigma-54 dependent transcriptional regulator [Roseateles depolymerans]ALV08023.1 ATPase AAA [Roseateles depolymerans]REG21757.1 Fis family sigma54 specific transcriptional regulator [Roseateles depolymerans]